MPDLSNVKAGDTLAYRTNYGREWGTIKVAKVGKIHLVDTNGIKYRLANGKRVGSSGFNFRSVEPMTPEIKRAIRLQNARSYIERNYSKLSDEAALHVANVMKGQLSEEGSP